MKKDSEGILVDLNPQQIRAVKQHIHRRPAKGDTPEDKRKGKGGPRLLFRGRMALDGRKRQDQAERRGRDNQVQEKNTFRTERPAGEEKRLSGCGACNPTAEDRAAPDDREEPQKQRIDRTGS